MSPDFESESLWVYYLKSFGWEFTPLMLAAIVIGLGATIWGLRRGKWALASAIIVLATSLPLLIGLWGTVEGALRSLKIMPIPERGSAAADIAAGVLTSFDTTQVGCWLTATIWIVALVGGAIQCLRHDDKVRP